MEDFHPLYQSTNRHAPGASWSTWRGQKDAPPPTEQEIVKKIVDAAKIDLEDGFILAVLYLSGSRVREVCPYKYSGIEQDKLDITRPGIQKKDIIPEEDLETGYKYVNIFTRVNKVFKAREGMTTEERFEKLSKYPYKEANIPYQQEQITFPLLQIIETYLENYEASPPETELVTCSARKIERLTDKYLGVNPHMIRHWRAKILVRDYGFTPQDLQVILGWRGFEMPMYYSRSERELIKKKLYMHDV